MTHAGGRAGPHRLDLPLQINTLVTDETLPDLPAAYELMKTLGIIRWSLFFLISMGRGSGLREIGPADSEQLNHWLYDLSKTSPFQIKTTEATHYRRVAIRRMARRGHGRGGDRGDVRRAAASASATATGSCSSPTTAPCLPSGFLPVPTGNVRTDDLVELYRDPSGLHRACAT